MKLHFALLVIPFALIGCEHTNPGAGASAGMLGHAYGQAALAQTNAAQANLNQSQANWSQSILNSSRAASAWSPLPAPKPNPLLRSGYGSGTTRTNYYLPGAASPYATGVSRYQPGLRGIYGF